jgi:predicted NBD/HSP70 family sugar kinase
MRLAISGNTDRNKQLNRNLVLQIIHRHGPITKAEISEKLDLTFATIGNITSELIKVKAVKISGYAKSDGGRPPALYEFDWNNFYVIALDIGVSVISSALVNFKDEIQLKYDLEMSGSNKNIPLVEKVFIAIDELLAKNNIPSSKIIGIGVSAPGPIDKNDGILISPPNLEGTKNVNVKQSLEDRYKLPTVLEKDANAAALAEQWFGTVHIDENILYIFADQGIGGGLIMDSRIYRGFHNSAGEIGHVSIDIDGPRCNCGNFGCLEAMASGISILRRVKEKIRRGVASSLTDIYLHGEEKLTLDIVIQHAREGDELAKVILNETGSYLGIGVANAINFFAPNKVLFGGEMIDLYPELIPVAEKIAKSRSFSRSANNIMFTKTSFGSESSLMGAASIIQQKLLDSPDQTILKR